MLDLLEFSDMSANCFSMVVKYFMHVALEVNDTARCTMKIAVLCLLHLK